MRSLSFFFSPHMLKHYRYKLLDCNVPEIVTVSIKLSIFVSICQKWTANPMHVSELKSETHVGAIDVCVTWQSCLLLFLIPSLILLPLTKFSMPFFFFFSLQTSAFLLVTIFPIIWSCNFTHFYCSLTTPLQIEGFSGVLRDTEN